MFNKLQFIYYILIYILISFQTKAQTLIKSDNKKNYYFLEALLADENSENGTRFPSPNVSQDSLFKTLLLHATYPQKAKDYKLQGNVFLSTTFGKDGKISAIDIEKIPNQLFDTTAVKLLMSTNGLWKAGQINNVDVEMTCTVVIGYSISTYRNKIYFGISTLFDKKRIIVDSSSNSPAILYEINDQKDTIRYINSKDVDASKLTFVESYGTVTIGLDIDTNGNISELAIVNSVTPKIDSDAIKYIRSTNGNWTPAIKEGIKKISHKEFDLKYYQYSELGYVSKRKNYINLKRSDVVDMENAMQLFDKKEYKKAILKLNMVCKYRIHDAEPFYYRGLSHLNLGNAEKGCEDIKLSMEIAEKYGYPIIMEREKVIDFLKKSCGE